MIVLGVDPGSLITGYGVIEFCNGKMRVLDCDAIRNEGERSMALRLQRIFERLTIVIEKHNPDEFAIETAFYGKNAQSALKLGQARGVAILTAVLREIPTAEYSPREVKKAVVGNGAASKVQIQQMVMAMLRLKSPPKFIDTTDALAVAICHLHRSSGGGRPSRPYRDWQSFVKANPARIVARRTSP